MKNFSLLDKTLVDSFYGTNTFMEGSVATGSPRRLSLSTPSSSRQNTPSPSMPTHTSRSMSFNTQKERLRKKLKREVKVPELYMHAHTKKYDGNTIINQRLAVIYTKGCISG
ncbi:hypothetical protein Sjap_015405 [Stephania japonica]|uniref:Uncharacterized protein n=1 Tax=Stephania japonica TaxID=461633 RepID=A0AAP0IJ69_9MAGN